VVAGLSWLAEQPGEGGDGFEQQRVDAGLLAGGVAGVELGDGAAVLGLAGPVAGRADDGDVEAAGAEGGVGDVDDLVAGGVQAGDGGAQRDGLPAADVSGDHPEGGFGDTEADPGDGLGVRLAGEQVFGGDPLAEWGAGQPEVGGPGCPGTAAPRLGCR
jgi:hypothetical protein